MKIVVREVAGKHRLLVQHPLIGESPAGWRLQRGFPLPIERFEFTDSREAFSSARLLQKYVDTHVSRN